MVKDLPPIRPIATSITTNALDERSSMGYENLRNMIGPLKRAAIDAYMCASEGDSSGWYIFEENAQYREKLQRGFPSPESDITVSRPDANGNGGGEVTSTLPLTSSRNYAQIFSSIREDIDTALEPWLHLPDPEQSYSVAQDFQSIVERLLQETDAADGQILTTSDMGTTLNDIVALQDSLHSATFTYFYSSFMQSVPNVLDGHRAIATILTQAALAEGELWSQARDNIVTIVDHATRALHAAAINSSLEDPTADVMFNFLTITGSYLGFVPSVGTIFSVMNTTLGHLKSLEGLVKKELQIDFPTSDYPTTISAFYNGINDLADALVDAESDIRTNLDENFNVVMGNQTAFDTSLDPNSDASPTERSDIEIASTSSDILKTDADISLDEDDLYHLVNRLMPTLHSQIDTEAAGVMVPNIGPAISRPSELGMNATDNFAALQRLLSDLMRDLSWDVKKAGQLLRRTFQELTDTDNAYAGTISDIGEDILEGSGYSPYDE